MNERHGLYRSRTDRVFGGVCSGVAKSLHTDPFIIRLIFVLLFIFAGGGILLYIILWIAIPEEPLPLFQEGNKGAEEQQGQEPGQSAPYSEPTLVYRHRNSGTLVAGLILIGVGIIFLADRFIPRIHFGDFWPLILVIAGVTLIATGFSNNQKY